MKLMQEDAVGALADILIVARKTAETAALVQLLPLLDAALMIVGRELAAQIRSGQDEEN